MVARTARAQLRVRPGVAGRQFSDAGLLEFPPRINPEAVRVSAQLAAAGVPVVSVTNTGRSAATWRWFFQTHSGPRFATVVASCDLGTAKPAPEIFLEAARRLRLPPASVLHVGDRWDLDVGGAVAAGLGAALYRGLWHAYPPGLYPAQAKPREVGDVARIDQLEELLERVRFATRRRD